MDVAKIAEIIKPIKEKKNRNPSSFGFKEGGVGSI
jgi:hypothetical protein